MRVERAEVDYRVTIELDASRFRLFLTRDFLLRLAETIIHTVDAPRGVH
jgi:hypothetical protein